MSRAKGHKALKVISVIFSVIIILIVLLIVKAMYDAKLRQEDQALMVKSDDELVGEHLYIERDSADDIDVNLYRFESEKPVPLVVNLHGGAFVAGDADTLDTQSERISKSWECTVVTVNYKLMADSMQKQWKLSKQQKKEGSE